MLQSETFFYVNILAKPQFSFSFFYNLSSTIADEDCLIEGRLRSHSTDKPVSLGDIISWCYQIAKGMEYLASIDVSL